jgi:hypothetical protein
LNAADSAISTMRANRGRATAAEAASNAVSFITELQGLGLGRSGFAIKHCPTLCYEVLQTVRRQSQGCSLGRIRIARGVFFQLTLEDLVDTFLCIRQIELDV